MDLNRKDDQPMKKFAILFTVVLLLLTANVVFAGEASKIYVDSRQIQFDDNSGIPYVSESGRTMVPLRKAMESMGVTVTWNPEYRNTVLSKGNKTLTLTLNSNVMTACEGYQINSDTTPVINNERTYLPIRVVAEYFGAKVLWNGQLNSVYLLTDAYENFRNMFTYKGVLSKYANVDTIVVTALYNGEMTEEEFETFWLAHDDQQIETYLRAIATDKKALNPDFEILINFFYTNHNKEEVNPYLGNVSSYSYEVRRYNPFENIVINELNQ